MVACKIHSSNNYQIELKRFFYQTNFLGEVTKFFIYHPIFMKPQMKLNEINLVKMMNICTPLNSTILVFSETTNKKYLKKQQKKVNESVIWEGFRNI